MKQFFKSVKTRILGAIGFASVSATSVSAAVDVSSVTLDTTAVETLAVVILGALAIIWVARKIIGFLGR